MELSIIDARDFLKEFQKFPLSKETIQRYDKDGNPVYVKLGIIASEGNAVRGYKALMISQETTVTPSGDITHDPMFTVMKNDNVITVASPNLEGNVSYYNHFHISGTV